MSTRCNIVVRCYKTVAYLYRHCDGYPAETGADLIEKMRAAIGTPDFYMSPEGAADTFLRSLLSEHYEQQSYEKAPRPVYEITSDVHGDIEHLYTVTFPHRFDGAGPAPVEIRHAARPSDWHEHGDGFAVERWCDGGARYTLPEFAETVNADRRACNRRIAQLRASSKHYADAADYPMVSA